MQNLVQTRVGNYPSHMIIKKFSRLPTVFYNGKGNCYYALTSSAPPFVQMKFKDHVPSQDPSSQARIKDYSLS